MKRILLIFFIATFAISAAQAQIITTETGVLKVAQTSLYSDNYSYTFGNPIKLNGNRKYGFASGVMSLIIPGLGQFYNGDEVGGSVYLLANILTKIWLMCPPTKTSTMGYGYYTYDYEQPNYAAPVVANILVTIISVFDAAIISKRVNEARDGYRLSGNSYLRVEPIVMNGSPSANYDYADLVCGVNCSLKF